MKKSLAVMLALIMVLCMIPTTAFAANMSWTWTVTIFGGNYYRSNGTETNTNKYTINKHLDNSVDHEIGYKFEWNASAGGNNYNGGWQLCLTVDGNIVERSTAYIYERDMSTASATWTAPKSSHTGNSSHPFTLSLSNYPARFQNITLTYNPNGGIGAPDPETQKVEKGQSAIFTVSAKEPTRENYNFKGWSTDENATTAEYKGGDRITINQNTTLYAVWEENNPTPPTTDKPEPAKPEPENTSKPVVGLTGKEVVNVKCTTNTVHPEKGYNLIEGSYDVGEVSGDKENGYTCKITVEPAKYVEQYNLDISGVTHTLVDSKQTGTIKLVWDNQKWKLATPSGVPVVFDVECETTQPPLDKTIPIEVSKVWEDDIPGAQSITVGLYANGTKVDEKDITPNEGIWYHNFGPRPLEDNNGRDISYTIVEEPIDGYTPHYYTSGEHDKRLVFRVKNVPTDKTGAIRVSKELSGEGADKNKEFAFTVTLLEYLDSDEVLDGGNPGYYPLSGIYTFGGFEFRDGKVTFGLKGGQSVTISGIPEGYNYTVTESDNAGYTVTSENDKGTIEGGKTADVKFTNTKSAAPTVSPSISPSPTPTPGGGNGGGGHWHPTTTPVPVIVIPPKTGDMTIWQSILHFLGII